MPTIKLPIQRNWDIHEDRENLYVELDLDDLREFITQVAKEAVIDMEQDK